jgi:hypothetical protein
MSDTNVADTYGGGSHRRAPFNVRPVPDGGDPGVNADSERVVESLSSVLSRAQNPSPTNNKQDAKQPVSTPLREIAARIKKLVHDDGEKFGDELKAIAATKRETGEISMAKALQLWADETGKDKPETPAPETNNK